MSSLNGKVTCLNGVAGIDLKALPPDKDGAITIAVTNTGNASFPLTLRQLWLLPRGIKRDPHDSRNLFSTPVSCTNISISSDVSSGELDPNNRYLSVKVVAKSPEGDLSINFDCGLEIDKAPQ